MNAQVWDLVGGDPAPGGPDAFDALARAFSTTASNAGDAHTTLGRLAGGVDDSVWRGEAADAFREKIGELPPQLQKLHDSYKTASEATATYSKTLRHLQTQAPALASQAQAAHNDEATWQHTRDQAVAQDPTASTATYDQAITNARNRLRQAQTNVSHLRDERTSAENALVGKLGDAHEQGIKNDRWGGLKRFLKAIGDACEVLGTILLVVAIVIVVVVLLTNPGGWAALAAAFAAAGPLFTAASVLGGIATATKAGRWLLGDSSVSGEGLLLDLALMATGPLGKLGRLGKFGEAGLAGGLFRAGRVRGAVSPSNVRESKQLGQWGERELAQVLGGKGSKPGSPFSTSLGRRYPDRLVNGVAHESKAGRNVELTRKVKTQIDKDAELIAKGKIDGAKWHFFQGADKETTAYLHEKGLPYTDYSKGDIALGRGVHTGGVLADN